MEKDPLELINSASCENRSHIITPSVLLKRWHANTGNDEDHLHMEETTFDPHQIKVFLFAYRSVIFNG
jgi:hypothetical protein